MDYLQLCLAAGVTNAVDLSTDQLVLDSGLRWYCKQNACGRYGQNYTCPPNIGDIDVCIEKLMSFPRAVLWQNIYTLADSFDFEGMMDAQRRHNGIALAILRAVRNESVAGKPLVLSAGGCMRCDPCAIAESLPCRFPQEAIASLEAFGVNVSQAAKAAGLRYTNGEGTVTFFGGLFYLPAAQCAVF